MKSTEKRWAIAGKLDGCWVLLGKFCWADAARKEPTIRTFATREKAREGKRRLRCYRYESRVVAVRVTITALAPRKD